MKIRYCKCKKPIPQLKRNGEVMSWYNYSRVRTCGDNDCIQAVKRIGRAAQIKFREKQKKLLSSELEIGTESIVDGTRYKVGVRQMLFRETQFGEWRRSTIDKSEFCRGIVCS